MAEVFMEMSPTFEKKKKTRKEVGDAILASSRARFGGTSSSRVVGPEVSIVEQPTISEDTIHDEIEFPSAVTEEYFRDWETLHVEANSEIKTRIRKNIIESERVHQGTYERAAKSAGLTMEEFKRRLQEKIETAIQESNFFRATKVDVLDKILNDSGRYKSQFETHISGGYLNPRYRAFAEMLMFGFNEPDNLDRSLSSEYDIPEEIIENDNENRPIYGYFSNSEYGVINYDGKIPPPNAVIQYGEVTVKIKKDRALQKATVSFQDSLGPKNDWPPTPACKPHFTSLEIEVYEEKGILDKIEKTSKTKWGSNYTEVQYHGQLRVDDIEAIYISTNNGLSNDEVEEVRRIYNKFKETHPESEIKLVEI